MKKYFELTFSNIKPADAEILIAYLDDFGFYGYETGDDFLKAYSEKQIDQEIIRHLLPDHCQISVQFIEDKDWNRLWEENMKPVLVDDFVYVRAHFHPGIDSVKYDIVITPKMSFGTGHHATTRLMIQQMRDIDLNDRTVIDFGTGTAILSILAEKMGAKKVYAIDNDPWCISNANDNIVNNKCRLISVFLSDNLYDFSKADLILANINLNTLKSHSSEIVSYLSDNGILILSGILEKDKDILSEVFVKKGMAVDSEKALDHWVSIRFKKSPRV